MCIIERIPSTPFKTQVLSEWTDFMSLARLHSAMCNISFRKEFLELISSPWFQVYLVEPKQYHMNKILWCGRKDISLIGQINLYNYLVQMLEMVKVNNNKVFRFIKSLSISRSESFTHYIIPPVYIDYLKFYFNLETLKICNCAFKHESVTLLDTISYNPGQQLALKNIEITNLVGGEESLAALFSLCSNIEVVNISYCSGAHNSKSFDFDGIFNAVRQHSSKSVHTVVLSYCDGINDSVVTMLSSFSNLTKLGLVKVERISTSSLEALAIKCPLLTDLSITRESAVQICATISFLLRCPLLQILNVSDSAGIDDEFLLLVGMHCLNLTDLDVSNTFPGISAQGIYQMLQTAGSQIRVLNMKHVQILHPDNLIPILRATTLSQLSCLTLTDTQISEEDLITIFSHCSHFMFTEFRVIGCNQKSEEKLSELIYRYPKLAKSLFEYF
jgi:hypothetical protein